MNRRIAPITSLLTLVCLVLSSLALAGSATADSTYPADTATSCNMASPATVEVDRDFTAEVSVTVTGNFPVTGRVRIVMQTPGNARVAPGTNARVIATQEADYNNMPVTFVIPRVRTAGDYELEMTFTPAGTALRGCSATRAFRVGGDVAPTANSGSSPDGDGGVNPDGDGGVNPDGDGGVNPDGDGGVNQNGVLPDTGGPALLWLVIGLGLLLSGGAVFAFSRRDPGSAYRS